MRSACALEQQRQQRAPRRRRQRMPTPPSTSRSIADALVDVADAQAAARRRAAQIEPGRRALSSAAALAIRGDGLARPAGVGERVAASVRRPRAPLVVAAAELERRAAVAAAPRDRTRARGGLARRRRGACGGARALAGAAPVQRDSASGSARARRLERERQPLVCARCASRQVRRALPRARGSWYGSIAVACARAPVVRTRCRRAQAPPRAAEAPRVEAGRLRRRRPATSAAGERHQLEHAARRRR